MTDKARELLEDAWSIAYSVRKDLDMHSCPDAYMTIAVESVVKHVSAINAALRTAPAFDCQDVFGSAAAAEAVRDAGELLRTAPEGWVRVPIKMTDAMRDAGNMYVKDRGALVSAYLAMLTDAQK